MQGLIQYKLEVFNSNKSNNANSNTEQPLLIGCYVPSILPNILQSQTYLYNNSMK